MSAPNEHVALIKKWVEKGAGGRWLHEQSYRHFKGVNNNFTYSTIVISTLTGIAGFAVGDNIYSPTIIACLNIVNGMLASFQKFERAAEKSESHLNAARQYASFVRSFTLELNISDDLNTNLVMLVKDCRNEYERINNIAPAVPYNVIEYFKERFPNSKHPPESCNGLTEFDHEQHAQVTKRSMIWTPQSPFRKRKSLEELGITV